MNYMALVINLDHHRAELLHEAEQERLVARALAGRSARRARPMPGGLAIGLAAALRVLARWIEPMPRLECACASELGPSRAL